MSEKRAAVPSSVKRQLRQESGFGCCRCGHPFIQYHHIIPWAEDKHYRPEDMMTVCGNCHHLFTASAIPQHEQRKYKARPKNIVENQLRGALWVTSPELTIRIGGGTAINTPDLLNFSGKTVLGARLNPEDGRILVRAIIQGKNAETIASLQDNEWSMRPDDVWDFEAHPCHAAVRLAPRDVAFSVDARNDVVDLQGRWFHAGHKVEFNPTFAAIGSNRMFAMNARNCGCMFRVG